MSVTAGDDFAHPGGAVRLPHDPVRDIVASRACFPVTPNSGGGAIESANADDTCHHNDPNPNTNPEQRTGPSKHRTGPTLGRVCLVVSAMMHH